MPSRLLRAVERQVCRQQGAGAYKTHVASNDIPQLRQLVKAGPAKEVAEWCKALFDGERPPVSVRPFLERPKLHEHERSTAVTRPNLPEKDGESHRGPDRCGDDCHRRGEDDD